MFEYQLVVPINRKKIISKIYEWEIVRRKCKTYNIAPTINEEQYDGSINVPNSRL